MIPCSPQEDNADREKYNRTLPVELRSRIFHLALLDTAEVRATESRYYGALNLSLLSTNRQIYFETRAIPFILRYIGNAYDPKVNFVSSLRLPSFQIAALKILGIEYLNPSDLTSFLETNNGFLFGERTLDLDLLVIFADDWIASGARRWRASASREDVQYDLPKSSRWLRALCELKGWKQLRIAFKPNEIVNEHWFRGGFMQTLFDDFRSHLGKPDADFTIWHESYDEWNERITVFRTKELWRYKKHEWWRANVARLMEGRECVLGGPLDVHEDEAATPAFHVQERCMRPGKRINHCPKCQPDCGCHPA